MKILGICGSPRGTKSQTRALLDALLAEAKTKGAQVEFVDLGKVRIGFCQACEACHKGPDCVLNDDCRPILRQMLEADGIVLASPVYLDHVTAQMKALLDRTSHFVHCLRLTGKYMAALTTSGGGGGEATMAFMKRYAVTVGAQFVGNVDARVPLKDADFASARELGSSIVAAISSKQSWPDQAQAIESQRIRFCNLISFHKDQWPYEYKYWQDKGWM
ncbi:MAG: flavodoxin family protein [bacterium]